MERIKLNLTNDKKDVESATERLAELFLMQLEIERSKKRTPKYKKDEKNQRKICRV